ncbi:alpha/beta hydrolase [Aquimarina sp. RZ0]|nr:alpha/beta hydrolase [Aquimarina sp. RZ0]
MILFLCIYPLSFLGYGQDIIKLPYETPIDIKWENSEKEYYSEIWGTKVITNVSEPTIQVFSPAKEKNTRAAVIIAPGGGLFAHSIYHEGTAVASWLAKRGITGIVLKYRLVPTAEDGVAEISNLVAQNSAKLTKEVSRIMPLSIQDGLQAISYIRQHANIYGIDPQKIGFMGFSAGGAVAMGIAYQYTKENRPDFLVPIYPWTTQMAVQEPKEDAPPILIFCASDDPIGLATGAIELYNSWYTRGLNAGLHIYAKGGHGFGMRKKELPSDTWIERFYDWSVTEGFAIAKE